MSKRITLTEAAELGYGNYSTLKYHAQKGTLRAVKTSERRGDVWTTTIADLRNWGKRSR